MNSCTDAHFSLKLSAPYVESSLKIWAQLIQLFWRSQDGNKETIQDTNTLTFYYLRGSTFQQFVTLTNAFPVFSDSCVTLCLILSLGAQDGYQELGLFGNGVGRHEVALHGGAEGDAVLTGSISPEKII